MKFALRGNLKAHIKVVHIGDRPFKCETCDKTFPLNKDLTRHKRIHTGEKPFECQQCDKKFTKKDGLTAHMRTHTGEKLFYCQTCKKGFSSKLNFSKHLKSKLHQIKEDLVDVKQEETDEGYLGKMNSEIA